jgi:hypothetical protein
MGVEGVAAAEVLAEAALGDLFRHWVLAAADYLALPMPRLADRMCRRHARKLPRLRSV